VQVILALEEFNETLANIESGHPGHAELVH
jgi:hypothetical protein